MIFLAALGLRLVLMPATYHADLLFIHHYPAYLSLHGVWDIYGHLAAQFASEGRAFYPPLVYFFVGAAQWLLGFFYPGALETIAAIPLASPAQAARPALVSWMKAPFLLVDMATLAVIARICRKGGLPADALRRWSFHPVVLFSVFVFGQYRGLDAFFLWAMMAFLFERKRSAAFVCFGALCLLDTFPALLLVPALLCLGEDAKARMKLGAVATATAVVVFIPLFLHSGTAFVGAYFSPLVRTMASKGILAGHGQWMAPLLKGLFLVSYASVIRKLWVMRPASWEERVDAFIASSAVILLVFYATTTTPVHYFLWVLPFWVTLRSRGALPAAVSWAAIAMLFVFNLDSRALNAGLLAPLDPAYFASLPSLHEVMDRFLPWGKGVASARLAFSAFCAYLAWTLWRRGLAVDGKSC